MFSRHRQIMPTIGKLSGIEPARLPIVYKMALLITGLLILCSGTLSAVLVYGQARVMNEQIGDFANTVVSHLAQAAQEPLLADDRLALEVLVSSLVNNHNVIGAEILNQNGESQVRAGVSPFTDAATEFPPSPSELTALADSRESWPWQIQYSGSIRTNVTTFVSPVRFADLTAGYALISFSRRELDNSKTIALRIIFAATLVIIAFGIGMAYLLSARISRPVKHFMDAIEAFDQGDFRFRFKDRRRDEIGQLMDAFERMADGMVRKAQVEKALDRYLSPRVARQVVTNLDEVKLGGKIVEGSVLFADIVGFTSLSEKTDPNDLAAILNRYFSLITSACEASQGTVDKYTGDGVMLLFGAPEEDTEHAFHAAACAILIHRLIARENESRIAAGQEPIALRIGLNAGRMLAGNVGSKDKMEYTVVGDTVNLASRLCSMAEPGSIVISRSFYDQNNLRQRLVAQEHRPMRLRGVESLVETYLLEDLTAEYLDKLDEQFNDITGQAT